jgi:hypothetical protein
MRVESKHPKTLSTGELGWIHKTGEEKIPYRPQPKPPPEPEQNWNVIWREMLDADTNRLGRLAPWAKSLGVDLASLMDLNCVWSYKNGAWAFPMSDGYGSMIGIRLRSTNGDKWAIKGSHQGIFLPRVPPDELVLLPEGPTDTAAALTLGYFAIGRPSCSGGMDQIRLACWRANIRRAVIVSDKDEPGLRGAEMLQRALVIPSAILLVPGKDLREFVKAGGTRKLLDTDIKNLVWKKKI